jgi:hypothetical protein
MMHGQKNIKLNIKIIGIFIFICLEHKRADKILWTDLQQSVPYINFLLTLRLLTGYKMFPGVEFSCTILAGIE